MDIATIKGAYEAVSFAKKALGAYVDSKATAKAKQEVTEALDRLGNVQDVLFSLREELVRLQDENSKLNQKISQFENWEDRSSAYKLQKTLGGAVIYYAEGPPEHYACPRCYESREIQILQDKKVVSGHFECPCCKSTFPMKTRERTAASARSKPNWRV